MAYGIIDKNYKKSQKAYQESNGVTKARNNMLTLAGQMPTYYNSYAKQMGSLYNQIKNGKEFSYDPANDLAYQKFAEEYNALSGLAIAGNQAQAQDLTGGFGSTYAPEVAQQGLARMKENVAYTQPMFYELARQGYMANNDALKDAYQVAANARDDELERYGRDADIWFNKYQNAAQLYSDNRDLDYNRYIANQNAWSEAKEQQRSLNQSIIDLRKTNKQNKKEYKLKSYDVYNQLAGNKCADFRDKADNKGMKAYLKGLVKKGKITQYMADNLYKQYKYVAPEPTEQKQTKQTTPEGVKDGIFYGDTTTNNFVSKYGDKGKGKIDSLLKAGKLTDYQAAWLKEYYKQNPPKSDFNGNNKTSDFIYNHRNIESGKKLENEVKKYYNSGKLTADEAAYLYAWYQNHSHNYDVNDKNDTNKNGKVMWDHLPNTHGGRVTR